MTDYTLRRIRESSLPDDYQFLFKGEPVGRVYSDTLNNERRFIWTIYINHNTQPQEGVALKGYVADLEEAKAAFRRNFDALIKGGKVSIK